MDLKLRTVILSICIDIEHSLKMKILQNFEISTDNGYDIVQRFFNCNQFKGDIVARNIFEKRHSFYIKGLLSKYIKNVDGLNTEHLFLIQNNNSNFYLDIPIWVLLETLTFGDLINFYDFYYDDIKNYQALHTCNPPINCNILHSIKSLRNACAHNNCILSNLKDKTSYAPSNVKSFLGKINVNNSAIRSRMINRTILEIACVLYSLYYIVPQKVKTHDINQFKIVLEEYDKKYKQILCNNTIIDSSFEFLKKCIDGIEKK